MAANAIYFPYINVPPDPWLMRMALYWDQVKAIVPMEFQWNPELLEPKMRDMISAGLVQALAPMEYLGGIDGFADDFLKSVERWQRPASGGREMPQTVIHAEKLHRLVQPLVEMGLARHVKGGDWYEMPSPVASRFMAHLARALGAVKAIDADPVTNVASLGHSVWKTGITAKRDALLVVLFPVPDGSVALKLEDIVEFKAKHQPLAARFRQQLHDECVLMANAATDEERQTLMEAMGRKLQGQVDEISDAMKGRWQKIFLGRLSPGIPLISLLDANATQVSTFIGGLASAGLAKFQASQAKATEDASLRKPMAYVALARDRLPALRPAYRNR